MQLTHMPCGVTPFADFGYQRYPVNPVLGDEVSLGLMIERAEGEVTAKLTWEKHGVNMPALFGKRASCSDDGRLLYVFDLGRMEGLHTVSYRFTATDDTGSVTTKPFGFKVLKQDVLCGPTRLLRGDSWAYALFEQLLLCLDWSSGLRITTLSTEAEVEGTEVDAVHEHLGDGLVLNIQKEPFSWELKRYTNSLVLVEGSSYRLFVDGQGSVHRITYCPVVAGAYIVGMGERFDSIDQRGNQLLCRVVEKYTRQGRNSYMPIPFFFTDQGIGWHSSTRRRLWFDASDGLCSVIRDAAHGRSQRNGG